MDTNIIILIIVIIISIAAAIGILIAYFNKKLKKPDDDKSAEVMLEVIKDLREEVQNSGLKNRQELQQRLDQIDQKLVKGIRHSSQTLQEQFKQSAEIISKVTNKLSKLDETNKQVLDFSKQLQSLENILKNPKQRGILGEYYLESLLKEVFQPSQYKLQYTFADGQIVDAVIFINKQIIPIDAKFSLEKYNKIMQTKNKENRAKLEKEFKSDIKKRIDETAKYIRPEEGTTDFAFMFIPAEGIYYNLLIYKVGTVDVNMQNLIEYAYNKKVIITSPTSFFAYLQTVLQGLKSLKTQESVKEILKNIQKLDKHLNAYKEHMDKVGNHLGTTVNVYNKASKEFLKVDKDIYKISDSKQGGKTELPLIEKPIKKDE